MSDVVIYNPNDVDIPNMVVEYIESVNTPDYVGNANTIINPDISALDSVASKYWKIDNDAVVEMSQSEKDIVDSRTEVPERNFLIEEYVSGKLSKATWYEVDNGDGTYDKKSKENIFTYSGNSLVSETETDYYADGSVISTKTWNYFTDRSNKIKKRVIS